MAPKNDNSFGKSCNFKVSHSVQTYSSLDVTTLCSFVNDLQKECFCFVWNENQDRISRTAIIKHIQNGGLNVQDIKNYIIALKLTWIRKLKTTNHQ